MQIFILQTRTGMSAEEADGPNSTASEAAVNSLENKIN
jgi:hypothetical protein